MLAGEASMPGWTTQWFGEAGSCCTTPSGQEIDFIGAAEPAATGCYADGVHPRAAFPRKVALGRLRYPESVSPGIEGLFAVSMPAPCWACLM